MTKTLLSFFVCLILPFTFQAQHLVKGVNDRPGLVDEPQSMPSPKSAQPESSSSQLIWSEDFSGGIPSSWVNQGYDVDPNSSAQTPNPLCNWEYRGPNTSPNRNTGSRGAWAAGTNPISSTTRTNGFIIFDSDYLDNAGSQTNPGSGDSPSPHIGTLTTDTIDLSGYPEVEVAMLSHVRQYSSRFLVAVSNDGGMTFTDTAEFHQDIPVNETNNNAERISANISATAGNESMVVLRFIFDGTPEVSTAQGPAWGYYYWQIDDIEVRELPDYSVRFVDWREAPAHDIIYPDGYARYGHINFEQVVPINFDSNLFNYGSKDLTNVRLKVEVQDASNNTTINTFYSQANASLASQDSLGFQNLTTTGSWTPSSTGSFNIIYSIESDSIPAAPGSFTPLDTFTLRVTDASISDGRYSFDWRSADNYVGTDNLQTGTMTALGERFNFPAPNKDTTDFVFVDGMTVFFDDDTDPNASIIWEVYDTTGFSYGASGGPQGSPIYQKNFQLDGSAPGSGFRFDFYDTLANGDAMPLALPAGDAYYFVMNMIPASAGGVVSVANDQTFDNPTFSVIAQASDGSWFGGFNNSDNLSGPIFRLHVTENPPYDIGIKTYEARNGVSVYPNPTTGEQVQIEFSRAGTYQMEIVDLQGKIVHSEELNVLENEQVSRDFSTLSKGIYMMSISNEAFIGRTKLQIK